MTSIKRRRFIESTHSHQQRSLPSQKRRFSAICDSQLSVSIKTSPHSLGWTFEGDVSPCPSASVLRIADLVQARDSLPEMMFANCAVRICLSRPNERLSMGNAAAEVTCRVLGSPGKMVPHFCVLYCTDSVQSGSLSFVLLAELKNECFNLSYYGSYSLQLMMGDMPVHSKPLTTVLLPEPSLLAPSEFVIADASTGGAVSKVCTYLAGNSQMLQIDMNEPESRDTCKNKFGDILGKLAEGIYTLNCCVADATTHYQYTRKFIVLKSQVQQRLVPPLRRPILLCRRLEPSSVRLSLCWDTRPAQLDLHMIRSNGDHVCYSFDSTAKEGDDEASAELEVESNSGCGPCTIVLRRLDRNSLYQVYVEHRAAAWADYQHRAYTGRALVDSNAHLSVWGSEGLLVDSLPIPLTADSDDTVAEDCYWWNILTIEPSSSTLVLHNSLSDRAPTIDALKKRLRARRAGTRPGSGSSGLRRRA